MMKKELILQTLLDEGYSEKNANMVIPDLLSLSAPLDSYLVAWVERRIVTEYTVQGYSVSRLQQERKMTYPAALLTLDWLIKEPDNALISLSRSK